MLGWPVLCHFQQIHMRTERWIPPQPQESLLDSFSFKSLYKPLPSVQPRLCFTVYMRTHRYPTLLMLSFSVLLSFTLLSTYFTSSLSLSPLSSVFRPLPPCSRLFFFNTVQNIHPFVFPCILFVFYFMVTLYSKVVFIDKCIK